VVPTTGALERPSPQQPQSPAHPGGGRTRGHHRRLGVSDKWIGNGRRDDHWRDTDVRIEGPAVTWLQAAFIENWRVATGELLGGAEYLPPQRTAGDVRVQVVRSSPAGGSYAAYTMVLLRFASARRSILMTNPYFVLDDRMTDALMARPGAASGSWRSHREHRPQPWYGRRVVVTSDR
jgi:phosphatidylserine/phosphatidylglycerophosphate/cardiolipin synthase-like enzyme